MTTTAPEQVEAPQKGFAGESIPRKEDERLLHGQGLFVADVMMPGTLHAAFLRSPHAHARIGAVVAVVAGAVDGVVEVDVSLSIPAMPPSGSPVVPQPATSANAAMKSTARRCIAPL